MQICLAEKDTNHLEEFKRCLNAENPIFHYSKETNETKNNKRDFATITITSPLIKDALIDKGCVPNKTFMLKYPNSNIVPEELQRHFIRGIFDGDGCITYSIYNMIYPKITFQIVGTLNIVTGIANHLYNNNVLEYYPHIYVVKSIYGVSVFGKYNAKCLMDYLYGGATVYLQRKYKKFVEIQSLDCNGDYPVAYISKKKCEICGDEKSMRYMTWHGKGNYYGKILCNKHYQQLYRYGALFDEIPYTKPQILCLNNKMIFDTKKQAAEWCGLKNSHGITKCIEGTQITSGKHPETGELLRWGEYSEENMCLNMNEVFDYKKIYQRIRERPVYQIDIETNEIVNRFESSCAAGRYLGKKNFSNITSVCKGRRPTAFGSKWAYCDEYDKKN